MVTRADIVRVARSWVDTPFQDKGRVKGLGIDCVGVPLMIAEELGLLDRNGEPLIGRLYATYPAQPVGTLVQDICKLHLCWKPMRKMQAGDIVTMSMPSAPCHVGIIGEVGLSGTTIIHAYAGGPKTCVEHFIDMAWRRRIVSCFEFPGISE